MALPIPISRSWDEGGFARNYAERIDGISSKARQLDEEKQRLRESLSQTCRSRSTTPSYYSTSKSSDPFLQTCDLDSIEKTLFTACSCQDHEGRLSTINEKLKIVLLDRQATISKLRSEIADIQMMKKTISCQAERHWHELNLEIGRLRSELLQARVRELDQSRMIESYRTEIVELKAALSTRSSLRREEAQTHARTSSLVQPSNLATLFEHLEVEKQDRLRFKQEVMDHGMKMVDEVRQRSADEHAVLLRRIAFLTEELDEASALRLQCQELERELLLAGTRASDMETLQLRQIERLADELDEARASAAELARSLRDCSERDTDLQRQAEHALSAARAAAVREADLVRAHAVHSAELRAALDAARAEAAAAAAAYSGLAGERADDARRAGLEGFARGAESRRAEIDTQARPGGAYPPAAGGPQRRRRCSRRAGGGCRAREGWGAAAGGGGRRAAAGVGGGARRPRCRGSDCPPPLPGPSSCEPSTPSLLKPCCFGRSRRAADTAEERWDGVRR